MSRRLKAVIFDVDGTLVDSERHGHRVAFNQAFADFGLPDHWDEATYGELLAVTGGQRRIDGWLARRGMAEAERAALAPALHARKTAIFNGLVEAGKVPARPGVVRLVGQLAGAGVRLAVATTGSRAWVEPALARALPGVAIEVVVAGDEVAERKPDPEAYLVVLDRLGVVPGAAVAVEDSANGLRSAAAAGVACAVVANPYTAGDDFGGADLVLDGFGEPDRPARVLADPHGTGCTGVLDLATLDALVLDGGPRPGA
ncbi:MAG: HAD-IA family hydrolase [Acidimicrobiales bacterium]